MDVPVGMKVPDFTLPDENGNQFHLYEELKKGPLILYFFPRDFTSGCTTEACEFRDNYDLFVKKGVRVAGISTDGAERHTSFKQKLTLPFHLLSDGGHRIADLFGVKRSLGIIPGRTTYLIGKDGTVLHVFSSQLQPKRHIAEALKAMERAGVGANNT